MNDLPPAVVAETSPGVYAAINRKAADRIAVLSPVDDGDDE